MRLQYLTDSRTPCRITSRKRFPEISGDIVMSVLDCYYGNISYIIRRLCVYTKRLTYTTIKVQQRR